jgi:hypothetical protein
MIPHGGRDFQTVTATVVADMAAPGAERDLC